MNINADDTWINIQVFDETGEFLGRVRRLIIDEESGEVSSLVISSITLLWIPEQLIRTYELSVDEVVSISPERLIVFEDASERLKQLTTGIGRRPSITEVKRRKWERYSMLPTVQPREPGDYWDDDENNDDYSGGIAPTPRPRRPPPSPINNEAAELPPS